MMHYELHISQEDFSLLERTAECKLPSESVALLFGTISHHITRVNRVKILKNEATNNRTTFSVNPEQQYQLLMEAEELDETLVAIHHSHPAPPVPSMKDIRNMRLNPVIWLISSKITGEWVTKAYALENEDVDLVTIKIKG